MDNLFSQLSQLQAVPIGIPINFNGLQPNIFQVPQARSEPFRYQNVIGDVRQGGSCNFETYTLNVHCNGTHIECVGHITSDRISILDCLKRHIFLANLVSVTPVLSKHTNESYTPHLQPTDQVITAKLLSQVIKPNTPTEVLMIRTLPNRSEKCFEHYLTIQPPFFTNDAMNLIVNLGFEHLIVDIPSVDRMFDEGKLSNHRIFWQVELGSTSINSRSRQNATITEFVFFPDTLADGSYYIVLNPAPFVADAAPIMPILYPRYE